MTRRLSPADEAELAKAVELLEGHHLIASLSAIVGRSMEDVARFVPAQLRTLAVEASRAALARAARMAIGSVAARRGGPLAPILSSTPLQTAAAALAGLGGGAGGLPATLVELPFTTTLMMRMIASIAQQEGEDLNTEAGQQACLAVFALGGPGPQDDEAEAGYYAVRLALAEFTTGVAGKAASRMAATIATKFGAPLAWKLAGQAVPGIGAAAGALINLAFMDHFRKRARGHFIVRRLERIYGSEAVQAAYAGLTPMNVRALSAQA
jgi:hypothetical protein